MLSSWEDCIYLIDGSDKGQNLVRRATNSELHATMVVINDNSIQHASGIEVAR